MKAVLAQPFVLDRYKARWLDHHKFFPSRRATYGQMAFDREKRHQITA
jgi:hypothetical protein